MVHWDVILSILQEGWMGTTGPVWRTWHGGSIWGGSAPSDLRAKSLRAQWCSMATRWDVCFWAISTVLPRQTHLACIKAQTICHQQGLAGPYRAAECRTVIASVIRAGQIRLCKGLTSSQSRLLHGSQGLLPHASGTPVCRIFQVYYFDC